MTFLNPFLLVALAAAAIPLLLHLLNLRKLRTVDFSSLRFLKELQKSRIRRLKLRQLLLLLLRIGLVVFAVLAFARPAVEGSIGLPGARASTTAVILLDNSYSMEVRDAGGVRFKAAQRAALDVIELLQEGDEAYLVPMTDVRAAAGVEPTRNREALRNAVNAMQYGYRRADLNDALRMAASLIDGSENLNKEVYIITDAQRSNVVGSDSLKVFAADVRVYLLPIGTGAVPAGTNLGLDSLRVLSSVFEVGKPIEVRAWVHNYGGDDVAGVPVSLLLNGERTAQGSVSVPAGASVAIDLAGAPKRPGLQGGSVELAADALDADNRRYFAFPVLGAMRVAVAASPQTRDYLSLALTLAGSNVNVRNVAPDGLAAVDLAGVEAVVLSDATVRDAARLAQFVEDGGGLVIFGGPGLDRNAFNSGLGASLGIALGAPLVADAGKPLVFGSVEREHPIFNGVFDPARPGTVESPKIAQAVPSAGGETIIRLSGGQPFMSEFRRGRGRVVYIGAPASQAWSDLPLKGIFVPLATRSVLYVGARGDLFPRTIVGENVTVPLPARANLPTQVRVAGPGGHDEFVPVRRYPSGASITYDRAGAPGVYRVLAGSEELALFSADMGNGESDLRPMPPDELQQAVAARMAAPERFSVLNPSGGDFADAITESRFGLELWKYMLGLALLCAFAEMLVGRTAKQNA